MLVSNSKVSISLNRLRKRDSPCQIHIKQCENILVAHY